MTKGVVVVKCGGSILNQLSEQFFHSMKQLQEMKLLPVIVHGGGPEINQLLTKLQVASEFVNGLRKTTAEVLEVVEMVLTGKVNKQIVTSIQQAGVDAIGISGCDGNLLTVAPIDQEKLGYVGNVTKVNANLLNQLLSMKLIPVIAPIGVDAYGFHYNINADTAAGAIAGAISAKKMIFVTDVAGIIKDDQLQKEITVSEINEMIADGTIYGGMLPKVTAAMKCLEGNIEEVYIIDGRAGDVVAGGQLIGTKIVKNSEKAGVSR